MTNACKGNSILRVRSRYRTSGRNVRPSPSALCKKEPIVLRRTFVTMLGVLILAMPVSAEETKPIKVLIITGDHGHAWKETTPFLKDLLTKAGMSVDVTETPAT